jgi:hypothetical protein
MAAKKRARKANAKHKVTKKGTTKRGTSASSTRSAKARKRGAKGAFVRSQPASMSAKDVVTKARDAGITISENYVYKLRMSGRQKGAGSKKGRSAGRAGTKTFWVLAQPTDAPAAQVAKQWNAEHPTEPITKGYVYEIRSKARREGRLTRPASGRRGPPAKARQGRRNGKTLERAFTEAAIALGLDAGFPRVQQLVEQVMAKVKALTV